MRHTMAMAIGVVVFALSLFCVAYAQQDINFFCKSECLQKAGTLGKCNALCSTTSDTGTKTKDTSCLSSCMGKSNQTAYSCYSACDTSGGAAGGTEETAPQSGPSTNNKVPH
jgi:hypothetical protein